MTPKEKSKTFLISLSMTDETQTSKKEDVPMTMTQADMQDRIIAKASADGEFRARLVAAPRAPSRS